MHVRRLIAALGLAVLTALPSVAQSPDRKVDIRTLPCGDLDKAEDSERVAAIFFFYGFHAAQLNAFEVTPANLDRNVQNIIAFCKANPATPLYEAVPKAYQR